MTTHVSPPRSAGTGLYRLKPWYASRLAPVLEILHAHHIRPDVVSASGVAAGAVGGALLALLPPGPAAAGAVLAAVAVRLGCANLDGSLARRRPAQPVGAVINELGDRVADLALLGGLAVRMIIQPNPSTIGAVLAGLMLCASCLPSWMAIAGAAAGGTRINGGPMGKTERAALAVVAAFTGWWVPVAAAVTIGSVLTAALRCRRLVGELVGGRS